MNSNQAYLRTLDNVSRVINEREELSAKHLSWILDLVIPHAAKECYGSLDIKADCLLASDQDRLRQLNYHLKTRRDGTLTITWAPTVKRQRFTLSCNRFYHAATEHHFRSLPNV
jgi:hypothetical protein